MNTSSRRTSSRGATFVVVHKRRPRHVTGRPPAALRAVPKEAEDFSGLIFYGQG